MNDKKKTEVKGKVIKNVSFRDSAPIPNMQIAPGKESNAKASADVPKMQLAPGKPPANKPKDSSKK